MSADPFNPQRMEIARARRMIPRRELAKRLGIRPTVLTHWRLSLAEPSHEQVEKMANILRWPLPWFYMEDMDISPADWNPLA